MSWNLNGPTGQMGTHQGHGLAGWGEVGRGAHSSVAFAETDKEAQGEMERLLQCEPR